MDSFFTYEYMEDTPPQQLPLPTQSVTDIYRFNGKIKNYDDRKSEYFRYDHNCNYPGYEGL